MTDRMDCLAVRKYTTKDGAEKTAFTKLGVAFPTKKGGWLLQLDAIPAPQEGVYKILLVEPQTREERAPRGDDAAAYRQASGGRDLDSEIPF